VSRDHMLASAWVRGTAYILDLIFLGFVSYILHFLLVSFFLSFTSTIIILLELGYFIFLSFKWNGQTIGKKLSHIKIVSIEEHLTLQKLTIRYLVLFLFLDLPALIYSFWHTDYVLSLFTIASIVFIAVVVFNKDRRGVHDLLAGTKVVKVS
jgi:uncharacterized RDD family membrane protein YckC